MGLKKNIKTQDKINKTEEQVEEAKAVVTEKNMTRQESEAIVAQQDTDKENGASTKKLEKATALLSGKFNLDNSYSVTNFTDKVNTVKLTLENKEFVLSVEIKDASRHGLILD